MIIHDVIQGTPEWHKVRAGKFTASTISALFMKESSKGYQDLLKRIARERVTGNPVESFKSEWMQRGNDLEAEALRQYELDNFIQVERVGFIEIDEWTGFSPDGLVGEKGLVQVKCPKWNTWFDLEVVDFDYETQCQAELWMSGRQWDDLYFYDPELAAKKIRIFPRAETIAEIQKKIEIAKPFVEMYMKQIELRKIACLCAGV